MRLICHVNNLPVDREIEPDLLLIDLVRALGFKSVKRGCETSNCGLCTVWVNDTPVLSCSVLAARVHHKRVTTLERVKERAAVVGRFLAEQGAEQCGFCAPGLIMNILAMEKEFPHPTTEEIRAYLAGNLCRCSGYESQLRAVTAYFECKQRGDLP
jgi:aerobic carbon-monoxide dehydrogenase small subunit